MLKFKGVLSIIDAPIVVLANDGNPAEALVKFYKDLGWNPGDYINPKKVKVAKDVYDNIISTIHENCSFYDYIEEFVVNLSPSLDEEVPPGKVYLLKGWTMPGNG